MFKDIDFVEFFMGLVCVIIAIGLFILPTIFEYESNEQIKQLEQNNAEQEEEKEYYITRTQQLENLLEGSGLVVDDCECN